ncbi:hypothetical protein EG833_00460 [archaeon]|nr:hypothetical protein [archaeon]
MKTVSAPVMLLVFLFTLLGGISRAADQATLVYYGTKTIDKLYEEENLYGPLLKAGTDRYFRPIVFLKSGGGYLDPYLAGMSARKDLIDQIESTSNCRVVLLGKCFGYDDFVLTGPGPRSAPEPGSAPVKKKGAKQKASAKTKKAGGLVLSNTRWDIHEMGGSHSRLYMGSVKSRRWQGYAGRNPGYYNQVATRLWDFDNDLKSSGTKPSFHFISFKDGVIGSYRFSAKSIEGSSYMVEKFFTVLNSGNIGILPLQYKKARDSEMIYLSDFDNNGTDNFALLIKYWDKGVYFSQVSIYEFREGWKLVFRTIPFGCHKQAGYEEF